MRKILTFAAAILLLSAAALSAQQNVIMIQVLDGYNGVAVARHAVSISTGVTADETKAHKNSMTVYTDARGILLFPLPQGVPGWIQLSAADMHACEPHPEAATYSLAQILSKGAAAPNKCSKLTVQLSPAHFVVYMRELTTTERAAMKH